MKKIHDKYEIFHHCNGEKIVDFIFYAETREKAYAQYLEYIKNSTVSHTFYYGRVHVYAIINDDGTISEKETLFNNERENYIISLYDIIRYKIYNIYNVIKYFIRDICFWIKNYDSKSCTSHMLSESWSLDYHILKDIRFNIPRIKDFNLKYGGIPNGYCDMARKQLQQDENYHVPNDVINSCTYTDIEFDLAKKLWFNELDNGLELINKYFYYLDYGVIDKTNADEVEIDKKYHSTIPYHPGTLTDINYEEYNKLVDETWNEIIEWFKNHGRKLWT